MFQLLQPTALWAAAAILVPVLIHLWNTREGRTLKVGSISLLQESARQQAKSVKLTDLFLLLLRCLLIIVLAFLLAKPVWQKQLSVGTEKGWMLMEKQGVSSAYQQYKKLVDSLQAEGYQFRYFSNDFPAEDWHKALETLADTTGNPNENDWTLLNRLNEQVPAELPVYLFTANQLNRFAGKRPKVALNLHWLTYSVADTVYRKPVALLNTAKGKTLLVANSTPTATFYTAENRGDGNGLTAEQIDTATLTVAIYSDGSGDDVRYVEAALEAIAQASRKKIKTVLLKAPDDAGKKGDWLFWLSEKPLPHFHSANVFRYEKGTVQPVQSLLYTTERTALTRQALQVLRSVAARPQEEAEPLWSDGYGNPVLSVDKRNGRIFHFYSRFNPAWTDLPWSSAFVQLLYDLLIHEHFDTSSFDKRQIDVGQMQVAVQENKTFDKQKFIDTADLSKLFWLLAFVLFALERSISLTRKPAAYA